MTQEHEQAPEEEWDYTEARRKLAPRHDNRKSARKTRQRQLTNSVDRRSLRASGRTEQFNFKSTPGLKKRAQEAAAREGVTLAEWMENAVQAALGGHDAAV
jgi:hypothetical protein